MSYIPDYRSEENYDKLNKIDKNYLAGYKACIEDVMTVFDNLDIYEVTEEEEKVITEFKECLEEWADCKEKEIVCSVFEDADYIEEDIVDVAPKLYSNTKGAKADE